MHDFDKYQKLRDSFYDSEGVHLYNQSAEPVSDLLPVLDGIILSYVQDRGGTRAGDAKDIVIALILMKTLERGQTKYRTHERPNR